jgi:membrane protease YdiL (CAAX protease family)
MGEKTMTAFQQIALLLTTFWLIVLAVQFRRSRLVIIGGLLIMGLYTIAAFVFGIVSPDELGISVTHSWLSTIGFALAWLGLLLAYSPLADLLASRWFEKPPTLDSFRVIRQSKSKLIAGIIVAWVLGGILEEIIVRGIVLKSVASLLDHWLITPVAMGVAVCIAALGAGIFHCYQGSRAMTIITQLSVLFGVLFVISGYNLWTVILCHGLYDTIAFIRFAGKKSKYSDFVKD